MRTSEEKIKGKSAKPHLLDRFVVGFQWRRNICRWWMQEIKRRRKTKGFYRWMVKRHGKPEYGCGAWSWHVNGILISLWIRPTRLKIYHCGGKQTISYELPVKRENQMARDEVLTIEKCTRNIPDNGTLTDADESRIT